MGKTPKKAAPGGDERNLYVRRLKATTAPSRASESSFLPERQRESESSNRPKLTGIQKKVPTGSGKNFKSKLRAPAKVGPNPAPKQLRLPMKNPEVKSTDMQAEANEAEVKVLNVSIQKENIKEGKSLGTNKSAEVEESVADKEHIDRNIPEQTSSEPSGKAVQETSVESEITSQEKEGTSLENIPNVESKAMEEQEENDIELKLDTESSPTKDGEGNDKWPKDDDKGGELTAAQDALKNGVNEKEEIQSEAQTDTESYSVDIVESTTSEMSETSESIVQNDTQRDKEKIDDIVNNDASFVSYDSSIMLKDVKVRLNDCLKDNSKFFDVSNMEDMPSHLTRDLSFGKTLRNISGRQSIGKVRHIAFMDRISPNSSLFVNTSAMSMLDEGTERKVGGFSDSFSTNGNSLKRKIETPTWDSAKKQKTEDTNSSLLSTSINLLKGLRSSRPVQVSTPNVAPYKFESTKLNISGIKDDDNKITIESTESTKKWCVIM